MIVLVTGSSRAEECAAAIERKTHLSMAVARSVAALKDWLVKAEVEALVVDESFQQVDGGVDGLLGSHVGAALLVYVNLSLHGAERIAQEVEFGLQRLGRERVLAMRATARELNSELKDEVTSLLLNTELAMREASLTPSASEKLRVVHEAAERMRRKLDGPTGLPDPRTAKARLARRGRPSHQGL